MFVAKNLIVFLFLSVSSSQAATCDSCTDITLQASGGLEEEYPRYFGIWTQTGTYMDIPFYECSAGCQGLRDKLVHKMFSIIISGKKN